MLTNNRIKFFDLHFFWHGSLVFVSGVKVTSASRRNESDFVAHDVELQKDRKLDFFTARAHISQNLVDAELVDNAHPLGRYTQTNEAVLCGYPEAMIMKIWLKAAAGTIHRVRNIITGGRFFAGYLANFGHNKIPL